MSNKSHDVSPTCTNSSSSLERRAGSILVVGGAFAPLPFRGASRWLRSLAQAWRHPDVSRLRVRLNPRLTTTLARLLVSHSVIELNPTVTRLNARSRREAICHEAAHFVVWKRHGRAARPHGPEWAALVKLAGFKPHASRVRCGHLARPSEMKSAFRHTCLVCHFSKRAARRMSRWRCPECRAIGLEGRFRIERTSP
jgi:predicted SprT family Zn-dependent metalloprotease